MMTPQERRIAFWALLALAIVIVLIAAKKGIQRMRKDIAEANPERDTSQLAVRFYQAIDGAGTDEEAIYRLAYECRGIFAEVARNYKARYGQALDQALAEDLESEELEKFYQILKS